MSLFKKKTGQTLIEVTVALIISAMTATAVFSVLLSSSAARVKTDKKELSAILVKEAQQTLQLFVSADITTPVYTSGGAYYTPGTTAANAGKWTADPSNTWALAGSGGGTMHDISSLMNTAQMAPLRGATPVCAWGNACYLVYTVTDNNCGFGAGTLNACKLVFFSLKYAD